ncbi:TonB-dependent receptor [Sphingomonas psychrolutea]|uniref:TonB-dependent receptor n=1 Tax=Sphingomonas psychrolutea TaxID=1259676 RepID=A0ABQ1G8G1_9SPHN|nr:TonB-dependent receptor [Sphingomonas psychrolutea]GGA38760.1 TonB-dependent receptor [Sphingomonas psychrolutea]
MKKFELLAASAVVLLAATPAFAQTTSANTGPAPQTAPAASTGSDDADIIVTATKREQTLQDVPVSVAVTGVDTIEKAKIHDLIDLQASVPSLKVYQLQSSGQTGFQIRGFGNGTGNIGIESSVGVFIDGVYRSRSASAISDLPDLERIEVLRGPQSTLFGKNVSAGAISIVTKRPQFTWGGSAEATAGNLGNIEAKASITGPITDTLAFRLYGNVNQREGYYSNLVNSVKVNGRNRYTLRGDVLFEPSSNFSVRIIADLNRIDEVCCGAVTIFNGPTTQLIGVPRAFGGVGGVVGNPATAFNRQVVYNTSPNNRLTGKGISGQVDWDVGFAKLTSITAYRTQTNDTSLDVDFTGADISNQTTADTIKTFTQEFRLASNSTGPFSWLLGGFYSDEKITSGRNILYGADARRFADAAVLGLSGQSLLATSPILQLEQLQRGAGNTTVVPGQTYFAQGTGIFDNYRLNDQSFSIFGQADYKLFDRLTLTAGGAYLNDRKAAVSNVVLTDRFSQLNLNNVPELGFLPLFLIACPNAQPCPASVPNAAIINSLPIPTNTFAGLNAVQFFYGDTANHGPVNFPNANESGILTGSKFTYLARAAFEVTKKINVYGSYSTGWKAGAYNLSSDSRPANNGVGRTANPENVEVYEAGAKTRFSGGFFNIAVFYEKIKGFQSNGFTGTGFALVNAGSQSVKGIEAEASYRPFRALVLNASATYLDPKYDSFSRAPCFSFDPRCQVPAGSPAGTRAPQFRDLTGTRPAGISKFSGNINAVYTQKFSETVSGFLRGEFVYSSKTALTDTVPASIASTEVKAVNASAGLVLADGFEIQGWVRNLTNQAYLIGAFNTVIQSGSYSGYINEPRTYGITLRKKF